jgi:hypothetical protein
MVQHSKPTEDLNKAVEDIETAYKQYTASVNRALTIAECSFKSKNSCLNEILEHKEMIIKMCRDRK